MIKTTDFHLIKFHRKYFLYLTRNLELFEIDRFTFKNLQNMKEQKGFNELSSEVAELISNQEKLPIEKNDKITTMSFNAAQSCNLRCSYCYAHEGTYDSVKGMILEKDVDIFIEALVKNREKFSFPLKIIFFGGEPLLNLPMIRYFILQASKNGLDLKYSITTNGTLLNPSVISFLEKHDFSLTISCDGPDFVQNEQRPFKDGVGSAKKVLSGIKLALNSGLCNNLTLRVTISKNSANFLDEILNYFSELSVSRLFFSPVSTPDGLGIIKKITDFFSSTLLEAVTSQNYNKINKISNLNNMILRFLGEKINQPFCPAGLNYFSVDTSGYVYLCHRFVGNKLYLLGESLGGINIAYSIKNELSRLPDKCTNCWALNICGGYGCYYENYLTNKKEKEPADHICFYIKKVIELSLIVYYFSDSFNEDLNKENINLI